MIPQRPGTENLVTRTHCGGRQVQVRVCDSNPGGGDVEAVGLAALDHLGVSCGDGDSGVPGGDGHRPYFMCQRLGFQPLLDDEGDGDRERGGAGDSEVVDRPVDRKLPDGSAGEDQRAHDEGVGGQGYAGVPKWKRCRIGERRERRVVEGRQQETLYELVSGLASGAVAHVYTRSGEPRRSAAILLQRVEDALILTLAHREPISTFSNDVRPKL
jgi:hypothetical protein